jgi:hypothetical protein
MIRSGHGPAARPADTLSPECVPPESGTGGNTPLGEPLASAGGSSFPRSLAHSRASGVKGSRAASVRRYEKKAARPVGRGGRHVPVCAYLGAFPRGCDFRSVYPDDQAFHGSVWVAVSAHTLPTPTRGYGRFRGIPRAHRQDRNSYPDLRKDLTGAYPRYPRRIGRDGLQNLAHRFNSGPRLRESPAQGQCGREMTALTVGANALNCPSRHRSGRPPGWRNGPGAPDHCGPVAGGRVRRRRAPRSWPGLSDGWPGGVPGLGRRGDLPSPPSRTLMGECTTGQWGTSRRY